LPLFEGRAIVGFISDAGSSRVAMGPHHAASGTAQSNQGETHMRSRLTKKRMLSLAGVLVIALAGIAYGFYSSTGSGSGSGNAAAGDGSTIVLTGGTQSADLVPGGSANIPLTAANAGNDGTIRSITGTVTVDDTHATAGCQASWFSIAPRSGLSIAVAHGASAVDAGNSVVSMTNDSGAQDACKGATLSYTFASN